MPPVDRRPRRASCHHGNLVRPGAVDSTPSEPPAVAATSVCLEPCRARAGHRPRRLGYSWKARDFNFLAFGAGHSGLRHPLSRSQPPVDPTRAATREAAAKTPGTGGHREHTAERAAASYPRGRSAGAWRDRGSRPDRFDSTCRLHRRSRARGDARIPGADNQPGAVQARARPAARAGGRDQLGMSGASGFSHEDHGAVCRGRGVRGGYERQGGSGNAPGARVTRSGSNGSPISHPGLRGRRESAGESWPEPAHGR